MALRTPDVQSSSAAKKGRKTKKKKKGAPQVQQDTEMRNSTAADEEDLDKILSELNIQTVMF